MSSVAKRHTARQLYATTRITTAPQHRSFAPKRQACSRQIGRLHAVTDATRTSTCERTTARVYLRITQVRALCADPVPARPGPGEATAPQPEAWSWFPAE